MLTTAKAAKKVFSRGSLRGKDPFAHYPFPQRGVKFNDRGLGYAERSEGGPNPRWKAIMNPAPIGVECISSTPPGLGIAVVPAIHGLHPWLCKLSHFVA